MEHPDQAFQYLIEPLPRGRVGFRRWRYELWRGATLLDSGWRLSPRDAERALCTAASRRTHERAGVRALRPDRAHALDRFIAGAVVRVHCGIATCVLAPRADELSPAAA